MRKDLPSHQNHTGTTCGCLSRPTVAIQTTRSRLRRVKACLVGTNVVCDFPDRGKVEAMSKTQSPKTDVTKKSEAEWKRDLTPMQFHVLREKGTERPFTGEYWDTKTPGAYLWGGGGARLFGPRPKSAPLGGGRAFTGRRMTRRSRSTSTTASSWSGLR